MVIHLVYRARFFLRSAMSKKHIALAGLLLWSGLWLSACSQPQATPPAQDAQEVTPANTLVLATTTSTYDSGLLDAILSDFEAKTGIQVEVVAVGTGQALKLGEAKDADVLLVHAKSREETFVKEGYAPFRKDVMYNDFIIVGPTDDPAGIRGASKAADAFKQIAQAKATFVSRGDESGTHMKEMNIWKEAGITPQGDWYLSAGQGMGAVLTMTNEQQAYTLSDRATYLARRNGLDLDILVEGDPILFNQYGVLPISQDQTHQDKFAAAMAFVDWITSPETQQLIAEFGKDKFGQQLFYPNATQ